MKLHCVTDLKEVSAKKKKNCVWQKRGLVSLEHRVQMFSIGFDLSAKQRSNIGSASGCRHLEVVVLWCVWAFHIVCFLRGAKHQFHLGGGGDPTLTSGIGPVSDKRRVSDYFWPASHLIKTPIKVVICMSHVDRIDISIYQYRYCRIEYWLIRYRSIKYDVHTTLQCKQWYVWLVDLSSLQYQYRYIDNCSTPNFHHCEI